MNNQDIDNSRINVAMKLMKSTEENISLSPEEEALLSDKETLEDIDALVSAQRSMLESEVALPDMDEELSNITGRRKARIIPFRNYIISAIVGAAAMLIAVFAFNYYKSTTPEGRMVAQLNESAGDDGLQTVSTNAGETLTLNMSDGTVITLNDNSRLDYPKHFNGNTRSVRLQGEALFKVSKDKKHPFVVMTDKMATKVLGTTFDVKAYKGKGASVALVEGSVEVTAGKSVKRIKPGERASVSKGEQIVVNEVNTDELTAWSDNQFYFDNQRLADIMDALGRWYGLQVVYKDESVKDLRLNFASPRNGSVEEAIKLLNSMERFKVVKEDRKLVVEQ